MKWIQKKREVEEMRKVPGMYNTDRHQEINTKKSQNRCGNNETNIKNIKTRKIKAERCRYLMWFDL